MRNRFVQQGLLSMAFLVPLQDQSAWTQLSFNKIPPNEVKIENGILTVKVDRSASPLIYKLPEIRRVSSLSFEASVTGATLPKASPLSFPEDSVARLGLIAKGEKTLGWFQKRVAANWVLSLFELAPPGTGLDKIYFFNLGTHQNQVGRQRAHPKSDLIFEEFIGAVTSPGDFKVTHRLSKPLDVVGLWMSIDGDESPAQFTTTIKNIRLE